MSLDDRAAAAPARTECEPKQRPILFSGPMVRAILDGRKSQTRRLVKPQPETTAVADTWKYWDREGGFFANADARFMAGILRRDCPYGKTGDRLWVREGLHRPDGDPWLYRADNQPVMVEREDETAMLVWAHHQNGDICNSMFMPRWASRITLELTDVRVEPLQEISEADARGEGIHYHAASHVWGEGLCFPTAAAAYAHLWDSINGKKAPWTTNPWVWVLSWNPLRIAPSQP